MNQYVYVLNNSNEPVMPCSPRKARILLRNGAAKVISRTPFTIRLLYCSHHACQEVTLGIDAGSKHIGLSATTESKELFAQEVKPRNDVVDLLSDRRMLRRGRRQRKTRYRAPRFENRVHGKNKGWLAPSVEVKIQEHITAILRVTRTLPVAKIVVETAEFDTQRLKAMMEGRPLPVGTDYQLGEMYDWYNVRQYVLFRDGYRCRCCGAHGEGIKLHVHHLESRKTGGNAPGNLITLCEKCHKDLHKGLITDAQLKKRKRPSMRDAAFMGIMRKTMLLRLREQTDIPVKETYGYITKYLREKYDIKKSHINDARCISKNPLAEPVEAVYKTRALRHHNRQLHRTVFSKGGIRRKAQAPYLMFGFRLWDKVSCQGKECFVSSRRSNGSFSIKTFDGEMVKDGITYKKLTLLEKAGSYITVQERRKGAASAPLTLCSA